MITERDQYRTGRLTTKPGAFSRKDKIAVGVQPLGLDNKRDGTLYIPKGYNDSSKPATLAVMLHGAGGSAEQGLSLLRQYADAENIILVAPIARKYSWDIIASDAFGPDVIFIDQALKFVFENYDIDSTHIAIGGFSDGASYALCIGLTNGDLFTHIIAFSPGFTFSLEKYGKPAVFISHGVEDAVLPIAPCARRIVPQLQRQGLQVNYTEFNGGHEIPVNISEKAVSWFAGHSSVPTV